MVRERHSFLYYRKGTPLKSVSRKETKELQEKKVNQATAVSLQLPGPPNPKLPKKVIIKISVQKGNLCAEEKKKIHGGATLQTESNHCSVSILKKKKKKHLL